MRKFYKDEGQVDALLELEEIFYMIQFKMGTPASAMQQIKEKLYQ